MNADGEGGLSHVLDDVRDVGDQDSKAKDADASDADSDVTVGKILDEIAHRGFGPLLLVPALMSISPVGAIPGMSVVSGSLIVILAVQMLLNFQHPWIPNKLESIQIPRKKLDSAVGRLRPWAKRISLWLRPRWEIVFERPLYYLAPMVMVVLALMYFPLALVPMGVFLPGVANTLFAVGLTVRDGLLMTLGFVATAASIAILVMA
ncbi:MAG: exopolysaccharide biosynthesis protein [bacterium]|nr:exopolysaccharide biosynthesis protein [bacterium]